MMDNIAHIAQFFNCMRLLVMNSFSQLSGQRDQRQEGLNNRQMREQQADAAQAVGTSIASRFGSGQREETLYKGVGVSGGKVARSYRKLDGVGSKVSSSGRGRKQTPYGASDCAAGSRRYRWPPAATATAVDPAGAGSRGGRGRFCGVGKRWHTSVSTGSVM